MGFPTLASSVTRTANNTTSFPASLPATVNTGDRVIAVVSWVRTVATNTALTPPGGWTSIGSQVSGGNARLATYYLDASSSIGGTSYTWSFNDTADVTVFYLVYSAGSFNPWEPPVFSGGANDFNPGNVDPIWGWGDAQWINCVAGDGTASVITPDGDYSGTLSNVTAGTVPVSSGVAFRDLAATVTNPGAWTMTGTSAGKSAVVAVLGFFSGIRTHRPKAQTNPTTGWSLVVPAGVQDGDDLVVVVVSRDHTVSDAFATCTDDDSGGNTWTLKSNSTDRKAYLFWKKATSGTAGKTVTIAGAIGSSTGGLIAFYGRKSGDPFNNLTIETNSSGDESHAGFTAAAGSIVCLGIVDYSNDNVISAGNGATIGSLGTPKLAALSTGGGDSAAGLFALHDSDGGATGTLGWSQGNGTTYSWSFELLAEDTGTEVEPSAVAATGSVQTATVSGGATVTPSPVTPTAAVQSATVAGHVTVTPSPVTASGAVQTASVSVGSTLSPTTVTPTGLVQTATVSGGATVTPNPVTGTGAVQAPTVTAGNVVNITPNPVAATGNVQTAAASAGSTVTPAAVQPEANIDDHTVTGGATVTPSTVTGSGNVQTAGVSGGATVTAAAITTSAVVNSPTVSGAAEVLAGVLAALGVIPVPTVEAGELVVHRRRFGTVSAGAKVGAATAGSKTGVVAAGRKQGVTD